MLSQAGGRLWWAMWLSLCAFSAHCVSKETGSKSPRPDADIPPELRAVESFQPLSSSSEKETAGDVTSASSSQKWSWETYHSHDIVRKYLASLTNSSEGRCRLKILNPTSVQGRKLFAVIAGQPDNRSNALGLPKPVFTWIGNMHGDETANRELLLRLAAGLCSGSLAAGSPRWRAMQDNTVVHIIPTMNPDGFARRKRLNANGVDLNRNFWTSSFPYPKPSPDEDLDGHSAAFVWAKVGNFSLQPEATAVVSHLLINPPDLSANLHGGALVANYPLDACDSLGNLEWCPSAEEPVTRLVSSAYAAANPALATNNKEPFVNGTVQGAAWYPVLGSMQDWVYHTLHQLHLTLELHSIKDPPASTLPALWNQNHRSMLRLMELARMGLRARVLDAVTRGPLSAAVTITRPMGVRGAAADAAAGGYFYKPMPPGVQYTFVVQPFDPANPRLRYRPISVRAMIAATQEEVVYGEGMQGLTVEQLLLAVRISSKKR